MDRAQEREFRRLVLHLADHLTDTETNKLVYIYDLPTAYKDKQPLIVLELMHNWNLFSASKPGSLAKIMKEIKRVDLAKTVEKHAKKTRKSGTKSRSASLEHEADPSFISSLQAKLEVLSIQSSISAHVVDQFLEMVRPTSMQRLKEVVEEAKFHVDTFRWLSKSAQVLLAIQPSLRRGTMECSSAAGRTKEKLTAWSAVGGANYTYIHTVPSGSGQLFHRVGHTPAQMVTGHTGADHDMPPTLPKPNKARIAGFRHLASPRVFPTHIPVADSRKLLTPPQEGLGCRSQSISSSGSHTSTSSSSAESDFDEVGYISHTVGDATGSGDSGFGESFKPPLRCGPGLYDRLEPPSEPRVTGVVCKKKLGPSKSADAAGASSDNEDQVYEHLEKLMKDAEYINVVP